MSAPEETIATIRSIFLFRREQRSTGGNGVADESAEELYEQAPCGYLSTTPEGRILKVNQTFAKLIGMAREMTSGKRFSDLLTIGGRIFYETHFALMLRMHREVSEIALIFIAGTGPWFRHW